MTDETAQAITLDYTIGLGIATVLILGLLIAGGNFLTEQRTSAARAELEVIGQQLAADLEAADRLVAAGGADPTVRLQRTLPDTVSGITYDVAVVGASDPYLRLSTDSPDLSLRVEFSNLTPVAASHVDGGSVVIRYTASDTLTLEDGDGT